MSPHPSKDPVKLLTATIRGSIYARMEKVRGTMNRSRFVDAALEAAIKKLEAQ